MPRSVVAVLLGLLVLRTIFAVLVVPPVVTDAQGYDASANRLLRTGTFAYPVDGSHWESTGEGLVLTPNGRKLFEQSPRNAYTVPGYPLFLASVYSLVDADDTRHMVIRVLQALISVVAAFLIWWIGSRFGSKVGLVALFAAAVYPPFTFANLYLLTESLYALLLLVAVTLVLAWMDDPRQLTALSAGIVFGAGLLVRPAMSPWLLVVVGIMLWIARGRERGDRLRWAARHVVLFVVGAVVILAPWWLRNWTLYERLVPFGTANGVVIEGFRADMYDQAPFPWEGTVGARGPWNEDAGRLITDVLDGGSYGGDAMAWNEYYRATTGSLVARLLRSHGPSVIGARARSIAIAVTRPAAVSPAALGGIPFGASSAVHLALLGLSVVGFASVIRRADGLLLLSLPLCALLVYSMTLPLNRYLLTVMPFVVIAAAVGAMRLIGGRGR